MALPTERSIGAGRDRVDVGGDADQRLDVVREIAVAGGARRRVARLGTRLHHHRDGVEPLDAAQLDHEMRRQPLVRAG